MRHDLKLNGYAYRLRPVADHDAAFVTELRGNPHLNRYLHACAPSISQQLAWMAQYYERPGDYYFMIERLGTGVADGLISIYDIREQDRSGEWGRWILQPESMAAVESAWLIYRCAFELLKLKQVFCRTVAENSAVVSFHDSCGLRTRTLLQGHFELNGKRMDAVEHRQSAEEWEEIGPRMQKLAEKIARRLQHV